MTCLTTLVAYYECPDTLQCFKCQLSQQASSTKQKKKEEKKVCAI